MEKNKIRICSDPYRKHIDYFWYNEGKWSDMENMDDSHLNSERFISQPVSHIAHDMLKEISELGHSMGGIEVIFEGTDDDFSDLTAIKDIYYSKCGIKLIRGSKKMKPANEVINHIEIAYKNLRQYFKEYQDEETNKVISKYSEAVKPEIAVCVMGLYSSGKSAFINSIIGQEILPSASDPATAKIYKIRESENCEIMFVFNGEDYRIEVDGLKWRINKNPNSKISTLIKDVINKNKKLTTAQIMYCTLAALNEFAKKEDEKRHEGLLKCAQEMLDSTELAAAKDNNEKIDKLLEKYRIKELIKRGNLPASELGDIIEVHINFIHSYLPLDRFKFAIYDTPGSDSVMFREHVDILKESLEQQTNGLPVFVTNPDSMDKTDNNKIMNIVNELGGALDTSNLLLVVNKSDEKSEEVLQEKAKNKDNLVVTKWKAGRVYFASSIIGLGGKKENPENEAEWINEEYYFIFYHNSKLFSSPNSKFYRRLFEYNILPKDASERISKKVENIEGRELLLWNSGIPCVEEEIGTFAQKYALYNKCSQAIQYLTTAAKMVKESVANAEREAECLRDKSKGRLDEKKELLKAALREKCKEKKKQFTSNFVNNTTGPVMPEYTEDVDRIKKIVLAVYKESPGKNDYAKLEPFNDKIESKLKADTKEYSEKTFNKIKEYWEKCAEDLENSLLTIVKESPHLSNEEKKILENEVLEVAKIPAIHNNLNIINTDAVWSMNFLFFIHLAWIDQESVAKKYLVSLTKDITNYNQRVISNNEKSFENWVEQILNKLGTVIASFNPELINLSKALENQVEVIEAKRKEDEFLTKIMEEIDQLLKFEEG